MHSQPILTPKVFRCLPLMLFLVGVIAWAAGAPPGPTLTAVASAGTPTATKAVSGPPSVEKLTIAMEAWGSDEINPVQMKIVNFLLPNHLPYLSTRDEHGDVVPGLVTKWDATPEGWTLTLDRDATWEDGTPITAEDLKFSFEATMGMHGFTGGFHAGVWLKQHLESVAILDAHTVFAKTKMPTATFFTFVSGAGYPIFWTVPKHYLTKVGHDGYVKKPMGGGPYKVKEWYPGDRIVYERNEAFWGKHPAYTQPQAKIVEIIRVPDGAARFAMLKSGQADVIIPADMGTAKDLPRQPGKGVWVRPIFGTAQALLSFNSVLAQQEGKCPSEPYWSCWPKANPDVEVGPFSDIRVREALELAIDKKTISAKVHGGLTTPLGSLYSLNSMGWRKEVSDTISPYNPERAKHLLREAGYPNGFSTKIYFSKARPGIPEYLEAVASYWDRIGVKVQLIETETGTYWDRIKAPFRTYQPLVLWTWGRQEDASIIANYSFHRAGSYVGAWNDRTNQLWDQLSKEWDQGRRNQMVAEMEDIILTNRWYIPLYNFAIVYGYTDRVLNHPHRPGASYFLDLHRLVLKN